MSASPRSLGGVSILELPLLPLRIARHIADALTHPSPPVPAPPADLVVVDGMPEGVPPAARRPEPKLPVPAEWPFGEAFPRSCGDVVDVGLAELRSSTITVTTDTATQLKLGGLPPGVEVQLDGQPSQATVAVPAGRHRITLAR
ncbi:hypothetical protein [Mycobacterium sp.]|uniref:hypothetical protein n=1 Tax=Mycobacterium sp. TaxID=1785 RepID=UPI003F96849C